MRMKNKQYRYTQRRYVIARWNEGSEYVEYLTAHNYFSSNLHNASIRYSEATMGQGLFKKHSAPRCPVFVCKVWVTYKYRYNDSVTANIYEVRLIKPNTYHKLEAMMHI